MLAKVMAIAEGINAVGRIARAIKRVWSAITRGAVRNSPAEPLRAKTEITKTNESGRGQITYVEYVSLPIVDGYEYQRPRVTSDGDRIEIRHRIGAGNIETRRYRGGGLKSAPRTGAAERRPGGGGRAG